MAELTQEQLQAALDRANTIPLTDGDVALQTADTMPEGVGDDFGTVLDTAGSEQHGAIRSFTKAEVRAALDALTGQQDEERTVEELKAELRELGEPVSGTKAELVARLEEARARDSGTVAATGAEGLQAGAGSDVEAGSAATSSEGADQDDGDQGASSRSSRGQ